MDHEWIRLDAGRLRPAREPLRSGGGAILPDVVQQLSVADRRSYVEVLILLANADGELVREEIAVIEQAMGACMLHPGQRDDLRSLLKDPPELETIMSGMSLEARRLAVRDGAILAAADGSYTDDEVELLRQLASYAELSPVVLERVFSWVQDGWAWQDSGRALIGIGTESDDTVPK